MKPYSKFGIARLAALCLSLGFALATASRAYGPVPPAVPELLPREREMAIALSAGPAHMAEQAGVYVLEQNGYVKVRESKNGFTCMIDRHSPQSFEPQCFDAEGTANSLPPVLYKAELRAQGKSEGEANRLVAEGYRTGRFRAPQRPGVVYMLSKEARVVADPATGNVLNSPPHVMFYAPYLTNAEVGAGPGSPVFVINEGTPGALMIVLLPAYQAEAKK
ncbi:MAG: hypothetical protein ACRD24_03435 [Terriglobales bacterium]